MFGVRIVLCAATLLGVAAVWPCERAEAKPRLSSGESYSRYLRQSLSGQHVRASYAKRSLRSSYAKQVSHAKQGARKSYSSRHSARKTYAYAGRNTATEIRVTATARASAGVGPRPARWCGWWMRTQLGGGPELNLARNWASWGRPSGPQVGAVVVWSHHVGMITGRSASGQWIVKSGNDGGRVRERPRSVAGAVFRVA
jgi:hypothetical protein